MIEARAAIAPPWAWFNTSMLFLMAALVFQRAAALADDWFARLGAFAFTGLLLDLALIFLAALISAGMFMRKYGHGVAVRRKLAIAYAIAFACWTLASWLLVAKLMGFAPVVWGLGGFSLGEVLAGALAAWGAVALRGRLFERTRAAVPEGVS